MYRVIIVDDEPVIRRGLRETIEWDALGLEVAGEAADGIEALKLIRETRPEILITDIRMPEMDGIELIREVKKLDLNIKITILSGYSDYDYLKAAIRLGVDNYLLKPIDNDELISNLRNAVDEIEKEAAVSLQIRQGTVLLRSNTLRRLVTGNINDEELREKAEFLRIPLEEDRYVCAVCTVSRQVPENIRESFFREAVAEKKDGRLAFMDGDGNLALLLMPKSGDRADIRREPDSLAEKAREEHGMTLMIGVGNEANTLAGIRGSYEAAREALEYGAFLKNGGIVWYDEVPETGQGEQIPDRVDYERMTEMIRKHQPEVLVTHGEKGEYGHGAHKTAADAAKNAVKAAASAKKYPDSAKKYGTWEVKKLYLHEYEKNPIVCDWDEPLEAFGGKTGYEVAEEAFQFHASQVKRDWAFEVHGDHDNAAFGLFHTTVGKDSGIGDLMENIPSAP